MAQHNTNQLFNESSPYLQQHVHNPVNWHPWNEKTLENAHKQNKPIVISIGYAACHWCHVMEKESFSDAEVASVMNENFICIKVDREERPDVDNIYMNAAMLTSGNGGWPLNAFALPDGRPFFAATYFPKEKWLYALKYFADTYQQNNKKLVEAAQTLSEGIAKVDTFAFEDGNKQLLGENEYHLALKAILSQVDIAHGGLKKVPKFPLPGLFSFLLYDATLHHNAKTWEAVRITIEKICMGGIFDHIGGGFARYSTDATWTVPHFEKMLYDNGLLLELCAQICSVKQNATIQLAAKKTAYFLLEKCLTEAGLFISAIDADSEGEEGAFYTWQYNELQEILGEDFAVFCTVFNVLPQGNFEGKIILEQKSSGELPPDKATIITQCLQKLGEKRTQRQHPQIDDKSLTAWNSMAVSGLLAYAKHFNDKNVENLALRVLGNILQKQWDGKTLYRKHHQSITTIAGFLDDYAFTAKALIDAYSCTFDERYLHLAKDIAEQMHKQFWNAKNAFFNFKSEQSAKLVAEPLEVTDNVIPSASATACIVLYNLGILFDNPSWLALTKTVVAKLCKSIKQNPAYHFSWLKLSYLISNTPWQLVFSGKNAQKAALEAATKYQHNSILMVAKEKTTVPILEGKAQSGALKIYPCKGKVCKAPLKSIKEWENS